MSNNLNKLFINICGTFRSQMAKRNVVFGHFCQEGTERCIGKVESDIRTKSKKIQSQMPGEIVINFGLCIFPFSLFDMKLSWNKE